MFSIDSNSIRFVNFCLRSFLFKQKKKQTGGFKFQVFYCVLLFHIKRMKSLVTIACTSFCVGFGSSVLYHYAKAHFTNGSNRKLNEVRFTCPSSACCVEEMKPDCRNPNCKARNEKRLIELIDSAQHTILLAMYIFTSKRLSDAIVAAHNRGVRVLIIGCRSMAYSSGSQMVLLEKHGKCD